MKILLTTLCFLLLIVIPIFGSPVQQQTKVLGGPKSKECLSGTYWCSSLQSAKQCNAIKHCIHAVWEKQHVPEDTDSICQICLDMVKQARDQLESNETQSDLKAVFEGSCNLIPIKSVAKECRKLADDFIPELVEALASQMNPQVVCSTAGLCNNAKIDKLLEEYTQQSVKKNLLSCDKCGTIGSIITARFRSSDRDTVLNGFLGFCGRMGSFSDACASIVLTYFNDIYSELRDNLNADNICHLSGTCSAKFHQHEDTIEIKPKSDIGYVKKQEGDDIPCQLCQQLVTHLRELLVANTTELEFKHVLQGLCKQFGSFKDECLSIVDQYYSVIYETLVNDLDANGACFMIGICPKNIGDFDSMPFRPLVPLHMEKPKKMLGEDEPLFTREEINRFQLPIERIDSVMGAPSYMQLVENGEYCTVCQYIFHFLQDELSIPKTEDEIKQVISTTCDRLPKFRSNCHQFIDLYGDALIALLVQGIDPREMCPRLKFCPTVKEDVDVFAPTEIDVSINDQKRKINPCPLCVLVVQEIVKKVDEKSTKEEIIQVLDKICHRFTSRFRVECEDFVETYTSELVDKLANNFTPKQICEDLKMCPTEKEPEVVLSGDVETNEIPDNTIGGVHISTFNKPYQSTPNCVMCEMVVKEVEKKLTQDSTKEEIISIMKKECSKLRKFESKCNQLIDQDVDKFLNIMQQILTNQLTPKQVCRLLGACFVTEDSDFQEVQDNPIDYIVNYVNLLCQLCERIVEIGFEKTFDSDTLQKFRESMKNYCTEIFKPRFGEECQKLLDEYFLKFFNFIYNEIKNHGITSDEVCKRFGACTNNLDDNFLDIDEALIVNVVAVPAYPTKSNQPELVRVPLQNKSSKIHMVVEITDAEDDEKDAKEVDSDGPECVLCEFIMTQLEKDLKNKTTDDEIKKAILNVCTHLPSTINKACTKFVNEYADFILTLLTTVSPKEVCQQMSLCSAVKKEMHLVGQSECTWGPSHFCSNEEIAEQCKATKYCQEQKIGKWSI